MAIDSPAKADCSVSTLIFTLNEGPNLHHCLDSLEWCDDIVVVDSYSTDETIELCRRRNIQSVQHTFSGFGSQRNWALSEIPLAHEWVLILDADERVPTELALELNRLAQTSPDCIGAYRLKRRFHLWGKWLRFSSLYPTWVVRFVRRPKVRYMNLGHSETQTVDGDLGQIEGYLIDENHKDLHAWFERQSRYSRQEADFEIEGENARDNWSDLVSRDPLRRRTVVKRIASQLPFRGTLYFMYCYIFRLGFLDGRDGYVFCRMKALYQSMIAINKYDLKKNRRAENVRDAGGADR